MIPRSLIWCSAHDWQSNPRRVGNNRKKHAPRHAVGGRVASRELSHFTVHLTATLNRLPTATLSQLTPRAHCYGPYEPFEPNVWAASVKHFFADIFDAFKTGLGAVCLLVRYQKLRDQSRLRTTQATPLSPRNPVHLKFQPIDSNHRARRNPQEARPIYL